MPSYCSQEGLFAVLCCVFLAALSPLFSLALLFTPKRLPVGEEGGRKLSPASRYRAALVTVLPMIVHFHLPGPDWTANGAASMPARPMPVPAGCLGMKVFFKAVAFAFYKS